MAPGPGTWPGAAGTWGLAHPGTGGGRRICGRVNQRCPYMGLQIQAISLLRRTRSLCAPPCASLCWDQLCAEVRPKVQRQRRALPGLRSGTPSARAGVRQDGSSGPCGYGSSELRDWRTVVSVIARLGWASDGPYSAPQVQPAATVAVSSGEGVAASAETRSVEACDRWDSRGGNDRTCSARSTPLDFRFSGWTSQCDCRGSRPIRPTSRRHRRVLGTRVQRLVADDYGSLSDWLDPASCARRTDIADRGP